MKTKKENIIVLKKAIKLRINILSEKNDIDDKLKLVHTLIMKIMNQLGTKSYNNRDGQIVRVMQMERDVWDEDGLHKFISKKLNKKYANEAVKTVSTRKVDDDVVLRLIQEKKITLKQVKKFITVRIGEPFVRFF